MWQDRWFAERQAAIMDPGTDIPGSLGIQLSLGFSDQTNASRLMQPMIQWSSMRASLLVGSTGS